jgi:hypothetical protein
VYENKGTYDKMPDTKGDISTQSHANLPRNRRNLQKPSALLSLFERWGTIPSLQNVEARKARFAGRSEGLLPLSFILRLCPTAHRTSTITSCELLFAFLLRLCPRWARPPAGMRGQPTEPRPKRLAGITSPAVK